MKDAEQAIAPSNRRTRGVDMMIPVIVRIAVALASPLRRGIADEFPKLSQKAPGRGDAPFTRGNIAPPSPGGAKRIGNGGIHGSGFRHHKGAGTLRVIVQLRRAGRFVSWRRACSDKRKIVRGLHEDATLCSHPVRISLLIDRNAAKSFSGLKFGEAPQQSSR